jgi:hypothetical protein
VRWNERELSVRAAAVFPAFTAAAPFVLVIGFNALKPVCMSTPATPSTPNPAGDDRNLVAVDSTTAVTFEEKMQVFWKKNKVVVIGLCVAILAAILGKGAWEYLGRQKELDVQKAYAAATTTEQLKSFSAAHAGHPLAGIAELRMGDEAYTAGKAAEAVASYDKAAGILKDGPLGARARIGRAVAKVQSGKATEASAELKQLAEDTKQSKSVRAEAAYHLTGIAVEAGSAMDAQKAVDLLNQIEPMGMWTQRATQLRATLPATPAPAAATPAPAAPEKKDEPAVQLKLPGAEKK